MTFDEFCRMFVALRSCDMREDECVIDDMVDAILSQYDKAVIRRIYEEYLQDGFFNIGCPDRDTRKYLASNFKISVGCLSDPNVSCNDCWKRTIRWYLDNALGTDFWKVS